MRRLLLTTKVAGVKHHEWVYGAPDDAGAGDLLELVPEPENQFDSNAIKILWQEQMIGYVPKEVAKLLTNMSMELKSGTTIKAAISDLNRDVAPWEMVKIDVYLEGKDE